MLGALGFKGRDERASIAAPHGECKLEPKLELVRIVGAVCDPGGLLPIAHLHGRRRVVLGMGVADHLVE
ncbi:MAG TPA: hypothetical protein VGJ38_12125 [Jatrophihabitantaceae bacterium]